MKKKYSQKDRSLLVDRIYQLDKETMIEFFEQIEFKDGQSIDFKTVSNEKLVQIDQKLKKAEESMQRLIKRMEK